MAMRHLHDEVADRIFGPLDRLRSDALRLNHENVAVGQRIDVAWARQASRDRLDSEAGGSGRGFTRLPADDLRNADGCDQLLDGVRQNWIGPDLLRWIDVLHLS